MAALLKAVIHNMFAEPLFRLYPSCSGTYSQGQVQVIWALSRSPVFMLLQTAWKASSLASFASRSTSTRGLRGASGPSLSLNPRSTLMASSCTVQDGIMSKVKLGWCMGDKACCINKQEHEAIPRIG